MFHCFQQNSRKSRYHHSFFKIVSSSCTHCDCRRSGLVSCLLRKISRLTRSHIELRFIMLLSGSNAQFQHILYGEMLWFRETVRRIRYNIHTDRHSVWRIVSRSTVHDNAALYVRHIHIRLLKLVHRLQCNVHDARSRWMDIHILQRVAIFRYYSLSHHSQLFSFVIRRV